MKIKKLTAEEELIQLIDFYSNYNTVDKQLKKLITMNLKQLLKRLQNEKKINKFDIFLIIFT